MQATAAPLISQQQPPTKNPTTKLNPEDFEWVKQRGKKVYAKIDGIIQEVKVESKVDPYDCRHNRTYVWYGEDFKRGTNLKLTDLRRTADEKIH